MRGEPAWHVTVMSWRPHALEHREQLCRDSLENPPRKACRPAPVPNRHHLGRVRRKHLTICRSGPPSRPPELQTDKGLQASTKALPPADRTLSSHHNPPYLYTANRSPPWRRK